MLAHDERLRVERTRLPNAKRAVAPLVERSAWRSGALHEVAALYWRTMSVSSARSLGVRGS
jgi:hypothetical protein